MTDLQSTRPLTENGRGGQVYFEPTFIRQLVCPLTPGEEIVAQTIPHSAVVLLPAEPEYPLKLTVRDPAQYRDNPYPSDHTHGTRQD